MRPRISRCALAFGMIPYKEIPYEVPPLPKRRKRGKGVPDELVFAHSVPEIY